MPPYSKHIPALLVLFALSLLAAAPAAASAPRQQPQRVNQQWVKGHGHHSLDYRSHEYDLHELDLATALNYFNSHSLPTDVWTPDLVHQVFLNTLSITSRHLDERDVNAAANILPRVGYGCVEGMWYQTTKRLNVIGLGLTSQQMLALLAMTQIDTAKAQDAASTASYWGLWSMLPSWGSATTKMSILSYVDILDNSYAITTAAAAPATNKSLGYNVGMVIIGYISRLPATDASAERHPLRIDAEMAAGKLAAFLRGMYSSLSESQREQLPRLLCVSGAIFLQAACHFSNSNSDLVKFAENLTCKDEKKTNDQVPIVFFPLLNVEPSVLRDRIRHTIFPFFNQSHCLAREALQLMRDYASTSLNRGPEREAWFVWLKKCADVASSYRSRRTTTYRHSTLGEV